MEIRVGRIKIEVVVSIEQVFSGCASQVAHRISSASDHKQRDSCPSVHGPCFPPRPTSSQAHEASRISPPLASRIFSETTPSQEGDFCQAERRRCIVTSKPTSI